MKEIIRSSGIILLILSLTSLSFIAKKAIAGHEEANCDLSQANYEKPVVFPQFGHSGLVSSVAFSPDGKLALSGSFDNTLKLWDITTCREIRTFRGHSKEITSVSISPDGNLALSGSKDNTIKLWNILTGKLIRTFNGHFGWVFSISFSPDGKFALSGHPQNLTLWETQSGNPIRIFKGHSDDVQSVCFSPDGNSALSGSMDQTIKLWNIQTGQLIKTLEGQQGRNPSIAKGHSDWVNSVCFSPDGQFALSGSKDATIKLWNIQTGKPIRTFIGHTLDVESVSFSPDGQMALSGSSDGTIKLWDISTGNVIKTLGTEHNYWPPDSGVSAAAFSPDGKLVLSGEVDNSLKLWDIQAGKLSSTIGLSYSKWVYSTSFSPDGKLALSGCEDKLLKLWDIQAGKLIRIFKGHSGRVYSTALSPDGKLALSGSNDGTIKLWNIHTGELIKTINMPYEFDPEVYSVMFSPDGKLALTGGGLSGLNLWDIHTGKLIRTFNFSDSVCSAEFSPDGNFIIAGSKMGTDNVHLWDIRTGEEIRVFPLHSDIAGPVTFSPNGKLALTCSSEGINDKLKLWNIQTGKLIHTFEGHSDLVDSISFSPDGKLALSGSRDDTIKLWDIQTGKLIRIFKGSLGQVNSVCFSPDGTIALSGSGDGTLRLWSIETGKELAQFVYFNNIEWVAITPAGYYNASATGDAFINVRIGNQVHGIDAFRKQFYRPDIVEEAIGLRSVDAAVAKLQKPNDQNFTIATLDKILPPTITVLQPLADTVTSEATVSLQYLVEDHNLPIQSVQVFANGYQVQGRNIQRIKKPDTAGGNTRVEHQMTLPLEPGDNHIRIVASNGKSTMEKSFRVIQQSATLKHKTDHPEYNLWVLAIGVSRYDHLPHSRQLAYADDDARAIADAFQKLEGKLYKKVYTRVISDDSAIQPTGDNIVDNLDFVTQAGQYDTAILFIAGHAMRDAKRNFYFLPKDASFEPNGDLKKSSAVRYSEFVAVMDQPARTLLFTDTCHAEGISGKKTRGIDSDEQVKFFQDTGAIILTSSRGDEESQESDKWGHGLFTYAILEGLRGAADVYKERPITMKELDAYISETVPRLSGGTQHPITFVPGGYDDFVIYANQ